MTVASNTTSIPHVLMFSFTGQGNLNPLLRLAKLIAAKGLLVTFSTNAETGQKIVAATGATPGLDHPVGQGFLRFDFLPDDVTFEDVQTSPENLTRLGKIGPQLVADIIRRLADDGRPVSCLINNPFVPWVLDVAADMNIPGALLWVQSCSVFSIYYHYYHSVVEFPSPDRLEVPVKLPGVPELKTHELPSFLSIEAHKSLKDVILQQFSNISKASWVFANSFEELEGEVIEILSERVALIPIGPLVEPEEEQGPSSVRGDMFEVEDCMAWLDAHEPHSVVYVALGSVVALNKEEMAEMAAGLLSCGHPFLWVVRSSSQQLLPDGYLNAIKSLNKGMIVRWSPQERVLAHRAVACFLTHCGWNSTLEALVAGTPVIAFPQFGDQVTNAKFIVDEYRTGVLLKSPVVQEEVMKCAEALMTGPEAEGIRKRAKEQSEASRRAIAEGGQSDRNIQAFVDELHRRACGIV